MKPSAWIGVIIAIVLAALGVVWLLWDSSPRTASGVPVSAPGDPAGAAPERDDRSRPPAPGAIRPRPFVPVDEAGPIREGGLLVSVSDAEDRPLAGAIVATCDPNTPVSQVSAQNTQHASTAADGSARVRLDVPLDVAHLIVLAPGHAPALVRITDSKQQRVRLGGEALLQGKVTVNGERPRSPLGFKVTGFIDPSRNWSESVQRRIQLLQAEPGTTLGAGASLSFDCDANGDFAVFGLTRGEIASIEIPAGYVFADPKPDLGKRERLFDCDGQPILLELSALNLLTGRIVRSNKAEQSGSDAPDLVIRYTFNVPGAAFPTTGDVSARLGDKFRIGFLEPKISAVTLDIWEGVYPGHRIGQKKFEQTITGSKDLGDIVLDDPVAVSFRLTDQAGQPIAKGRVLAAGAVSPETDADGRTKLGLDPGTHGVVVGAPGFRIEGVRLPESLPSSMEVRLRAGSMVIVRVRHEDPNEPLRGLRVFVSYAVDEVGAAAEGSPRFMEVRGERGSDWSRSQGSGPGGPGVYGRASGGHQTHVYDVQPGHDVVVGGFKEGDEVKVSLQDRSGYALIEESVRLGDEEAKAMELVVRSKPKAIRFSVVDEKGRPLAKTRARVGDGFPSGEDLECDSSGKFELPDVYGPEPVILVSAPGYVPKSVHAPEIFQSPTIVLESARQLSVRLTGASTGSIHGSVTFAIPDGEIYTAFQRGEDVYVFDAVPRRNGTVRVQGRKATSSTAVGAEETRIVVARPE